MPDKVRQITVLEEGDPKKTRTSTRRISTRVSSREDSGFYDENGYIPIRTGDIVIVNLLDEKFTPTPETEKEDDKFLKDLKPEHTRKVSALKEYKTDEQPTNPENLIRTRDAFGELIVARYEVIKGFKIAEEIANKTVARPGNSNYQKGTALDIVAVPTSAASCDRPTTERLKNDPRATKVLEEIMLEAGFAKLDSETWRFEIPTAEQVSNTSYQASRTVPANVAMIA